MKKWQIGEQERGEKAFLEIHGEKLESLIYVISLILL